VVPQRAPQDATWEDRRLPLADLRAATRSDHDRLEARLALGRAASSPAAWAAVLRAFLGFVEPMEARLAASPLAGALPDLHERLRAPLLRADLRALGEDPTAAPRCTDLPAAGALAEAFGVAYVLEGSTLGGAVIARTVGRDAPELAGALRFFGAAGPQAAARWRGFLAALERWPATAEDRHRAGGAAAATFATLERWLDRAKVLA
jgi:heme oxygenase